MSKILQQLDERTSLPFKIIVPLIAVIIAAAGWLHAAIADLKKTRQESWTVKNQDYFVTQLRAANTNIMVPSVADALRHEREVVR